LPANLTGLLRISAALETISPTKNSAGSLKLPLSSAGVHSQTSDRTGEITRFFTSHRSPAIEAGIDKRISLLNFRSQQSGVSQPT
jgi:cAMP phosphodiesterase